MASTSRSAVKRFPIGAQCTGSCRLEEHAYQLLCACASGNLTLLLHCAKRCGNPFRNCDNLGRNTLHIAAMCGHNSMVEWILERQLVDVNCCDIESRWTPLHYSIHFGQPGTAILLMKFNANLFAKDFNRQMPLSFLSEDKKWKDKPLIDKTIKALVVSDYEPTASDELKLIKGHIVEVVKMLSYGWCKGKMEDRVGIFPSDNIEMIEHQPQEVEQQSLHVVRINTYSWGSNSNVTLGHEMSKQYPQKLKMLTNYGIKQVVLCKFHTVFLSRRGEVFTCGHGRGGRLGHGNEQSIIEPKLIDSLKIFKCVSIGASRNHTIVADDRGVVYTCGLNDAHQLGLGNSAMNAPKSSLLPKQVNLKGRTVIAVGAGRYHSAVCTEHEVFTFGKNLGQLGLSRGLDYQIGPRQVMKLNDDTITQLSVSDSATACLTSRHQIYLWQNHTTRPITVFYGRPVFPTGVECVQFSVCASLVEVDSEHGKETSNTSDLSSCTIMFLTTKCELWQWDTIGKALQPVYMKGLSTNKVVHFALGKQLSVVTDSGEIYTGSISKQYGSGGSSVSSGGRRRLGSDSPDPVILDHMTCYKMKSITCVQNATKIFTDFKGNNLAALQKIYGPKQYPDIEPSSFHTDLLTLCSAGFTSLSDLTIEVDTEVFQVHKFILSTRCPLFKSLLSTSIPREIPSIITSCDQYHIKVNCKRPDIFQLLLEYIYSGLLYIKVVSDSSVIPANNNTLQDISAVKDTLNTSVDSTGSLDNDLTTLYDDYALVNGQNNVIGQEELLNTSFHSVESMDSTATTGADLTFGSECSQAQVHFCTKKDLGVLLQLAESLQMDYLSSNIHSARKSGKREILIINQHHLMKYNKSLDHHDIVLVSKEGDKFPCHKCILAARSEYFQIMLMAGWRESSVETLMLSLSFPGNVLKAVVHFLYGDEVRAIKDSRNVEFVSAVLITADQLLLTRLKNMCENILAHLLTIRNVADIASFADNYHAEQLKSACLQFICLNLAPLLEGRYLESLDPAVLPDLSQTYQSLVNVVQKRIVKFPDPQDIPESYFRDEELDSDYETFITSLGESSSQLSIPGIDKVSPQSAASKKRKRKRNSDSKSESGTTTSPTSPGASQGATTPDRRGSLTDTTTPSKEDTMSPPAPVMASTPRRSRSSEKTVNGSMNRKRLSDLFQPQDKQNASVTPSKSADAVLTAPQRRSNSLTHQEDTAKGNSSNKPIPIPSTNKKGVPQDKIKVNGFTSSNSPLAKSPPSGNPWNLMGTSPPAVSLRKLMEEESVMKKQQKQEARSREAAAAKITSAAQARTPAGWQKLTSQHSVQDGSPPPSFAAIVRAEEQVYSDKTKVSSKPMQLIQIEEEAIQALEKLYGIADNADENITVERLNQEYGVPLWVTEHRII